MIRASMDGNPDALFLWVKLKYYF